MAMKKKRKKRKKKATRTGRGVVGRLGKRYELTDDAWDRIEPMLPRQQRDGQWADHRTVLNGMFWVLNSWAQWRDMPDRYGKWQTVYGRYRRWMREELFDRILHRLTWSLMMPAALTGAFSMLMDRIFVRTARLRSVQKTRKNRASEPGDFALGRSRGGFGTKFHLVTDGNGVPLGALVTAGQTHESKLFEQLMDTVHIRQRRRPGAVAGDKGYSYPRIRKWLSLHGVEAVIPSRSNQPQVKLDKRKYRRRNVVERCIGWLKEARHVATRYEKLAIHYLAMLKLAMIQRCIRLLDPSNRI